MKMLRVPSPITYRTGQVGADGQPTKATISFVDFVHDHVLPSFGKKLKDVQRALKVYERLTKSVELVYLDDSQVDELVKVCEEVDWNPFVALQVTPFFDALIEAKTSAADVTP